MADFFGKPGKSGPPGNSNAKKHGAHTVRRERKELRTRAINGRTSEGRYVADQRGDLIASLGGSDNVSVQQAWLTEEAAFLRLELAYVRAYLATVSPINKRKRTAHPIVKDYVGLVNALRGVLGDLGLQRQAREVPSLQSYLTSRTSSTGSEQLEPPAPAPPAPQPEPPTTAATHATEAPAAPAEDV